MTTVIPPTPVPIVPRAVGERRGPAGARIVPERRPAQLPRVAEDLDRLPGTARFADIDVPHRITP